MHQAVSEIIKADNTWPVTSDQWMNIMTAIVLVAITGNSVLAHQKHQLASMRQHTWLDGIKHILIIACSRLFVSTNIKWWGLLANVFKCSLLDFPIIIIVCKLIASARRLVNRDKNLSHWHCSVVTAPNIIERRCNSWMQYNSDGRLVKRLFQQHLSWIEIALRVLVNIQRRDRWSQRWPCDVWC